MCLHGKRFLFCAYQIGKCVHTFIIDCEVDTLEKRMKTTNVGQTFITAQLDDFRNRTLPMVKSLDDRGKLTIVSNRKHTWTSSEM